MVHILLTPFSLRVPVNKTGQLEGTQIYLENYLKKFNHSTWDHTLRRMVIAKRYVYYNRKTNVLYMPRYSLGSFIMFLQANGISYTTEELPLSYGKDVDIQLLPGIGPRNQKQADAIEHLSTTTEHVRGLALNTGQGKTFSAIATIIRLGKRAMISVVGLVDQWEKEIYNFTNLTPDDVYIIQGAPSMMKLLSQIDRNIHPKVILCSLGTIRNYVLDKDAYENCPPFDELMDRLGVGVRVADEAHLNFWLSMMVDLRTNANVNIALTATFERSDHQVKLIFNEHYPESIRYGENEYNRYIDVYSYSYTLGGMLLPMKAYSTPKGYNHSKLEDYLLRRAPTKLEYIYAMVYSPIIFSHYVNIRKKGDKLLILCSTIDMCKWFMNRLRQDLPQQENFKVNIYISETEDSVLVDSDVIVSTPGSAGCLSGDTEVRIHRNRDSYMCSLKNAYLHFNGLGKRPQYNWDENTPTYVRSFNGSTVQLGEVGNIIYSGVKDVYKVTLENGKFIKCTDNHPIMTDSGWIKARDVVGKMVMCDDIHPQKSNGRQVLKDDYFTVTEHHPYARKSTKNNQYTSYRIEFHRAVYEAIILNNCTFDEYVKRLKTQESARLMQFVNPNIYDIHHKDFDHYNNDPSNLEILTKQEHKKLHSERTKYNFNQGIPYYVKAVSIEYVGEEDTYDIHCVDKEHNYAANDIIVHNTGTDIKNLLTMLVSVASGSDVFNKQSLGRLRELPDGRNPRYIYTWNRDIQPHCNYQEIKQRTYSQRGKSFNEIVLG